MHDSTSAPRTRLESFRWRLALLFTGLIAQPALERVIGPHANLAQLIAAILDPRARPQVVFTVEGMGFAVGLGRGLEVRLRHRDRCYSQPIRDRADLPAAMRQARHEPWGW